LANKYSFKCLYSILASLLLILNITFCWAVSYEFSYAINILLIECTRTGIIPIIFTAIANIYGVTIGGNLTGIIVSGYFLSSTGIATAVDIFSSFNFSGK